MSIGQYLRSEAAAWALGSLLVAGACGFAFALFSWLGIGLVGLIGLTISIAVALHGGHAVGGMGVGQGGDLPLYLRQLEETRRSQASPEEKLQAEAAGQERLRILFLVDSVFIAMTALGFGFFFLHDL
ncbi:MAG TPA: hypothetical protein VKN76_15645 [Kiloniellaceae bacterium]|nr:hypothetical protein [Kiloniellaceae bacterium]